MSNESQLEELLNNALTRLGAEACYSDWDATGKHFLPVLNTERGKN